MADKKSILIFLVTLVFVVGCDSPTPIAAPYPIISDVRWIVPENIPSTVHLGASNNNLALANFQGRLWLAFRSAPTHFASSETKMFVVSSGDLGKTWRLEHEVALGTDVREPQLLPWNNSLIFFYVELGKNPAAFEPKHVWRETMASDRRWSPREPSGFQDETMIWEMKVRDGAAWVSTYRGNHYSTSQPSDLSVSLKKSNDGLNWQDVDPAHPVLYQGGVSEVGFEFDEAGNLWGIGRNEDGDDTGFGSQFFTAAANELGHWTHLAKSDPYRYDSPRTLRVGNEIYLIARRNIAYIDPVQEAFLTAPYDLGFTFGSIVEKRDAYLAVYSALPKRTSIYHLDRQSQKVVWLKDLPSCGDTAFASIVPLSSKKFLVANYSNPILDNPNTRRWPWISGQVSADHGTKIYLTTIEFP